MSITVDIYIAASADDGFVESYGGSFPPSTNQNAGTSDADFYIQRDKYGSNYFISLGLWRFNTGAVLPASCTVTAADLKLYVLAALDSNEGRNFQAEYYGPENWPIGVGDWQSAPVGSGAIAPVDIDAVVASVGAYHAFALQNLSGVSKSGYTGLRLGVAITGDATPTANSYGRFGAFDAGSSIPYLRITYTLPYTAMGAVAGAAAVIVASGTRTSLAKTGTAVVASAPVVVSASGIFNAVNSGAVTAAPATVAAGGAYAPFPRTGTADVTAAAASCASAGTRTPPPKVGMGSMIAAAPVVTIAYDSHIVGGGTIAGKRAFSWGAGTVVGILPPPSTSGIRILPWLRPAL